MEDYFTRNRANWDERAGIHARSTFYGLDNYRRDPGRIGETVAFDRPYLGDLTGTSTVHLQCHIGTDTLSLARLGATVTGLDLSPESIAIAEDLFRSTDTAGTFVAANVYDAVEALGRTYELVYTGVGALGWLPDIDRWAAVVAALLEPGGRLYLREGHPMMWAIDETFTERFVLGYPYFETAEPMAFDEPKTYTDGEEELTNARSYSWNHGLGEIVTALLNHGLILTTLEEHRTLDWQFHESMEPIDGRYRLPEQQRDMVPLMYTIIAVKPA